MCRIINEAFRAIFQEGPCLALNVALAALEFHFNLPCRTVRHELEAYDTNTEQHQLYRVHCYVVVGSSPERREITVNVALVNSSGLLDRGGASLFDHQESDEILLDFGLVNNQIQITPRGASNLGRRSGPTTSIDLTRGG